MVPIVALLFGLVIGSFLNVVVHRVPRRESLVSPGSACPLRYADPGPAQRSRPGLAPRAVRGLQCPISVRFPLVEAGTGLLFAALA